MSLPIPILGELALWVYRPFMKRLMRSGLANLQRLIEPTKEVGQVRRGVAEPAVVRAEEPPTRSPIVAASGSYDTRPPSPRRSSSRPPRDDAAVQVLEPRTGLVLSACRDIAALGER